MLDNAFIVNCYRVNGGQVYREILIYCYNAGINTLQNTLKLNRCCINTYPTRACLVKDVIAKTYNLNAELKTK